MREEDIDVSVCQVSSRPGYLSFPLQSCCLAEFKIGWIEGKLNIVYEKCDTFFTPLPSHSRGPGRREINALSVGLVGIQNISAQFFLTSIMSLFAPNS